MTDHRATTAVEQLAVRAVAIPAGWNLTGPVGRGVQMEVAAVQPKLRCPQLSCRPSASWTFGGTDPERSCCEQEPSSEQASA
jgi:hypothetical protein